MVQPLAFLNKNLFVKCFIFLQFKNKSSEHNSANKLLTNNKKKMMNMILNFECLNQNQQRIYVFESDMFDMNGKYECLKLLFIYCI